ncbi:putative TetR family transcriptional regulator [Gordonia araii NBRC 100433]|uniref:Putative TetR family transcriptional regulator n=1 Tax=Gordonia araii NBRC 100433 TaxID=1073574 RepID=G7GZ09_9ACTN|nr:TetR/AcrR family transcriptional regulator [Gordonia araii]GAB08834.1 putative TetR family transcriptional regulator [Gordonia araii NBRC 100433]
MALLEEHDSAEAVSIRAVANAVGVSSPAIYLHFADKDALLDAVCGQYFDRLDEALALAEDDQTHPLDRVRALGRTYVQFALDHRAVYQFAFGHTGSDGTPMVDEALRTAAFNRLAGTVRELVDIGWVAEASSGVDEDAHTLQVALELWTVVHGVASLMIAKPDLPWGDDLEVAESVMRSGCLGRALLPVVGERATGAEVERFVDDVRSADGHRAK